MIFQFLKDAREPESHKSENTNSLIFYFSPFSVRFQYSPFKKNGNLIKRLEETEQSDNFPFRISSRAVGRFFV